MCSPAVMGEVKEKVSRKTFLGALGAAVVVGAAAPLSRAEAASERRFTTVVDLTHQIFPGFPNYFEEDMEITPIFTVPETGFGVNRLSIPEHFGTHMDAQAHIVADGATAENIPVEDLVVPLKVIDISNQAASNDDAEVTVGDVRAFERRHGRIQPGSFVAMYSGWESRLPGPGYLNRDPSSRTYHFPGFGGEAAEFLVAERGIVGIGSDTHSLDIGASTTFGAHVAVLGEGLYGIECMANLGRVRPSGATIVVGGPTHRGATGGQARLFALA